jgi:hypothetical protein
MIRRTFSRLALGAAMTAALAAPSLAAHDGAAAQFMLSDQNPGTAAPLEPVLAEGSAPRTADASLLSLRYRERGRPARNDHRTIVVTERPAPLEARYHPRRGGRSSGPSVYGGSTQIHGGFFDPDGDAQSGILFGLRGGPRLDEHVQLGASLDWRHRSASFTDVIGTGTGPGGEEIEIRRELGRSTSDWVPLQLFLELNAGNDMPVIPYFGLAGGYQWLGISGDDFSNGSAFDATFGGWGWQAYGGLALPIGPRTRLNAEVFINESDLHRESIDALTGDEVRESIDMDGVGMRFGLAWGFF